MRVADLDLSLVNLFSVILLPIDGSLKIVDIIVEVGAESKVVGSGRVTPNEGEAAGCQRQQQHHQKQHQYL